MASSVGLTRSRSPTDAPPTVTSTSASAAPRSFSSSFDACRAAMPSSHGLAAEAWAMSAARPYGLEDTIWSGPGSVPGSTSSSPVARMAMRGCRRTGSCAWPQAAASAMAAASSRRPARSSTSPARKSPPAARTLAPGYAGSRTMSLSPLRSVSSWITTASAPCGTLRAGENARRLAGPDRAVERPPACDSPMTRKLGRHLADVGCAHRIAVHGGGIERRLRQRCRDVLGEHALARRRAGRRSRRQAGVTPSRMRRSASSTGSSAPAHVTLSGAFLRDIRRSGRRTSAVTRTPSMRMPRSTAFSMS